MAINTFSVCEREQGAGHPAPLAFFSLFLVSSIVIQIMFQYFNIVGTGGKLAPAQGACLFGILTSLSFLLLYFLLSWVKTLFTQSQDFIAGLLLILGSIVALSTLIKPVPYQTWFHFWSDLIHSFPFTGLIGILATTLMIGIWQGWQRDKGSRKIVFLAMHGGAVVFLIGTGITSFFGIHGILNMHEGETASAFHPLVNQRSVQTSEMLPAQIKLLDFHAEYYDQQHELRIYQHNKGGYDPIRSLKKESPGVYSIEDTTIIEVVQYYPEFSVDYKIIEQLASTPDTLSAGLITVSRGTEQQSDWIFATQNKDGYLQGDDLFITITRQPLKETLASFLRFQEREPSSHTSQALLLSAKEKAYILVAQGKKRSQTVSFNTLPLNIPLENLHVAIEKLHPDALVETTYKSFSDAPKNPVVEVNITTNNGTQPYLLAAAKPQPIPLGNEKFLIFESIPAQPKLFKSLVQVMPLDTSMKPATHEVMVNQPLSLGNYKIYQADFRKWDPAFSGFSVTFDPGRKVVIAGFVLMAFGALMHLFVAGRPKEKLL